MVLTAYTLLPKIIWERTVEIRAPTGSQKNISALALVPRPKAVGSVCSHLQAAGFHASATSDTTKENLCV